MGVEAAVCEAGLFHYAGDTCAVVTAAPDGASADIDDAFVRGVLAAGGSSADGDAHMTTIIFLLGVKRK
jgi:hypothetical protein